MSLLNIKKRREFVAKRETMELHYVYIYLYHVYQRYLLINNKIMFRRIWISRSRVQFPLALSIWRRHVTRSRDILLRKEIVRSAKQFVRFTGMREKFCDEILNFCTDLFKNISECLTNGYCECKQNVFARLFELRFHRSLIGMGSW